MNSNLSLDKKSAFTLIELLVVIAIIGILSAVVLTSLNSSRDKANDSSKISGVKSASRAMELDRNQLTGFFSTYNTTAAAAIGLQEYLERWPTDVEFVDNTSDNTIYCIYAVLQNSSANYIVASENSAGFRTTLPVLGDCDADM